MFSLPMKQVVARQYKNQLVIVVVLTMSLWLLRDYFIFNLQTMLALLCAPFVFKIKEKNVHSWRYGLAFLFFTLAYFFLGTHMLLFFALGCLVMFSVELMVGKQGTLPFFFLVSISPALYYIVHSFTFPLRLQLSKYAAVWLNYMGMQVENQGSYFTLHDGFTFSVDSACIGLNMFCTGLCLTALMIGFTEQKTKKHLGFFPVCALMLSAVVLLVLTNFLRIVTLVLFRSLPDTASHECTGIFSLLAYTALPMYALIQWSVKKWGRHILITPATENRYIPKKVLLLGVFCIAIVAVHIKVNYDRTHLIKDLKVAQLELPGYQKTMAKMGVAEFRNGESIIYIKPAVRAFEGDHSPALCWRASGFDLVDFNEKQIVGFTVFAGTLKKNNTIQYTAWWYDNGTQKTIDQWKWRFGKGEPYRIINITASQKNELEKLCTDFLKKKLF